MLRAMMTILVLSGMANVGFAGVPNAPAPQHPAPVAQPAPFPGPAKIGGLPTDPSDCRYTDTCSNGG